jgi:hypothetical protein
VETQGLELKAGVCGQARSTHTYRKLISLYMTIFTRSSVPVQMYQ